MSKNSSSKNFDCLQRSFCFYIIILFLDFALFTLFTSSKNKPKELFFSSGKKG